MTNITPVRVQCPHCLKQWEMELPYSSGEYHSRWLRWMADIVIRPRATANAVKAAQWAFPELSARQRDALATGTCDVCAAKMARGEDIESPF